jgi:uncharacterized membrane protein YccC
MDKTTKFKEAFKVALAFTIAYGVALKLSWMNPSWAGFGVVMIAMATEGQSIHKGLNRMAGTIPACIVALLIFSVAAQERWLFMFLAALWISFTTYMMVRSKNNPYLWNVAGFVALIILVSHPITSENVFNHALYRTLETAMGISVYTLVSVFLWPRKNTGIVTKISTDLIATQMARYQAASNCVSGKGELDKVESLVKQNLQQLNQLSGALISESSENYDVYQLQPVWNRYIALSMGVMETQNRIDTSLEDFEKINVDVVLPALQDFLKELDQRFGEVKEVLNGGSGSPVRDKFSLSIDQKEFLKLSGLNRAVLEVTKKELEKLDALTIELRECANDLAGVSATRSASNRRNAQVKKKLWLPVPDRDAVKNALFAGFVVCIGFGIWVFFNPVGHSGWFSTLPIVAMAIAGAPQARIIMIFKPMALIFPLGILVYVFIMPHLSSFMGLGILLFVSMFIVRFFFSGIAMLFGGLTIINMYAISNHQMYSFPALANAYIFMLGIVIGGFVVSYMLGSPRPEKVVMKFTRQFFRNAEFLLSKLLLAQNRKHTLFEKWQIAYYQKQMQLIPNKIKARSTAIDHKLFPNNSAEQIESLVTVLHGIRYRIDELLEAGSDAGVTAAAEHEMLADLRHWNKGLEHAFAMWSVQPEAQAEDKQIHGIKDWLTAFETKVEESMSSVGNTLTEEEGEGFFRLLGGYRGVSLAVAKYTQVAHSIDWEQWREERFS